MQLIKTCFTILAVLLPAIIVFGQEEAPPVKYYNSLMAGAAFGKKSLGTTGSFAIINGIRYDRYHFGIGLGYDEYLRESNDWSGIRITRWKAMPVFLSAGVDVAGLKSGNLYFQINGGYSRTWNRNPDEYFQFKDVKGGAMFLPMLGYRVNSGRYNLQIATGYRWQLNKYTYGYSFSPAGMRVEVSETMERFVVQIGIGLN